MLRIRLQRTGRKNQARYRIVVAEHARAVKKNFVEILGHYNPSKKPHEFVINKTKLNSWIKKGAQPTKRIEYLVAQAEKNAKK